MILAKRKAQVITWADSIKYGETDGDKISPIFVPLYLTVCVTGAGAGVDSAWEQENAEARKMLENAAESQTSGARCTLC